VVNAVVAEHAAAGPEKVVKTPDLPEQLAHPFGTGVEVEVVACGRGNLWAVTQPVRL
jgi:hypothetical protein